MLTSHEDSRTLQLETPVTLWRYSPARLAVAKARGRISAVGYVTASSETVESGIVPRCPVDQEIIRPKVPVYLAQTDYFEPDLSRMITPEQAADIQRLAERNRGLTRDKASGPCSGRPESGEWGAVQQPPRSVGRLTNNPGF